MLKEYADGNSIEVEVMYGTTEKVNLNSKNFLTPNFETDGRISNRYKQLSYDSSFEKYYKEDNYETFQFKQEKLLLDQLKTNLRDALIDTFINYAYKYLKTGLFIIPKEFIIDQNNVIDMNDEVKLWVEEEFEFVPSFKNFQI